MKKIEFQYFNGCPNAKETLHNVQYLLESKEFVDCELKIVEVPNPGLAQELNFQGSPTILFNGVDIYTEQTPNNYSYSCRIFNIDNGQTGVMSVDYIRKKLTKLGLMQPSNRKQ